MADNENNNDLNEEVEMEVDDAEVITVPIDATLTNSGEAADAKAVGDALALKADKSEIQTSIKVNGQSADNQGLILVTAKDTKMSDTDPTTVKARIEAVDGKTAEDIPASSAAGAPSIAQALQNGSTRTADQISMSATDNSSVKENINALAGGLEELAGTVVNMDEKTAAQIRYQAGSNESIKAHVDTLEGETVKRVNEREPDDSGNVTLIRVPYADNLYTDEMEQVDGSFIARTTGGDLGISGVNAWILKLMGNRVHAGYVEESIALTVIPIPRQTPPAITATIDEATFEAYVEEAGTYTLSYDGEAWSHDPADYGLTISNTPVDGDVITIVWDGENNATVSITAGPRTAPPAITATVDRDTFVAYVPASTTIVLTYTTEWSASPALYGITVSNEPIAGDQIKVVYVKEVRGTITPAQPTGLVATGWNLYNHTLGYARVVKYSNSYGYRIDGTYTSIAFAETPTGTTVSITPDANGKFSITGDGYIIVTGGNGTDTCVYPVWSDWGDGHEGSWAAYSEGGVSLSAVMASFPYGLCKVGEIRDEVDYNQMQAIRRIGRVAYTAENLAEAKASGRAYEYDENYIYSVLESPVVTEISAGNAYGCNDHGLEWFAGTAVAVYAEILYGQNLKDKLRRDVVTVRAQSFNSDQKAQARENIGVPDYVSGYVAGEIETVLNSLGLTWYNNGLYVKP